jgi:Tfp pilus assembly protein PilO
MTVSRNEMIEIGKYQKHAIVIEAAGSYRQINEYVRTVTELNKFICFSDWVAKAQGKIYVHMKALAYIYTQPD